LCSHIGLLTYNGIFTTCQHVEFSLNMGPQPDVLILRHMQKAYVEPMNPTIHMLEH
jgi:hypothetical protein